MTEKQQILCQQRVLVTNDKDEEEEKKAYHCSPAG